MTICCALSAVKSSISNLYNSIVMDPKQTLYNLQMERFEVFNTQDPENEHFDVVFDIHGQKLYANKFLLFSISTTFNSMLSDRWIKLNEPVKIEEYGFDDFKELITFIYSGECQLTDDNIFSMVDIAEFYAVNDLKMYCDEYLTKMEIDFANVFEMIRFADAYSLTHLQKILVDFASNDISTFLKSKKVVHLPKLFIKDLLKSNQKTPRQEELFKTVFKWAELRAMKLQANDNNLDLNDLIKIQMHDLLPFFNSKLMTHSFLIKFVVRKQFLFSDVELKNIMFRAQNEVYVKVIDGCGKIMRGYLQCHDTDKVVEVIKSTKKVSCTHYRDGIIYWKTSTTKPKRPSKLISTDDIQWYLLYSTSVKVGDISIKRRNELINGNYLLAEMFADNGFILDEKCQIEVV